MLADAGIQRTLHNINNGQLFQSASTSLTPNNGEITTEVTAWGPYLLVRSTGGYANQSVTNTALIGSVPPDYFKAAITVTDENYPLMIAGDSRIYGDVNTGPQGLIPGRIKGEGVTSEEFHTGIVNIHQSLSVPHLNRDVLNQYQNEMNSRRTRIECTEHGSKVMGPESNVIFNNCNSIYIENNLIIDGSTLRQPTDIKSIFVNGTVEICGKSQISGLIEIMAEGSILVTDSAYLDEVILWAGDSVVIGSNTTFSGIAICSTEISVKDEATLLYPSMLLLSNMEVPSDAETSISLTSKGLLESTCYVSRDSSQDHSSQCLIYLDTASRYSGYLVSEDKTDLRGILLGSVVTDQFHYYLPPTTYVNWIKDARISIQGLDHTPALPMLETIHGNQFYRIIREDSDIL